MVKILILKITVLLLTLLITISCMAAPARIVLLDFTDDTAVKTLPGGMTGSINKQSIARNGIYFLSRALLDNKNFVLVDRREFMKQMDRLRLTDGAVQTGRLVTGAMAKPTPVRPDMIQAAQALRADAVLRGALISLSDSGQRITQGGEDVSFNTLTLRVMLEALDAVDGTVIAVADGSAERKIRQTRYVHTRLGEDDILQLLETAIMKGVPTLEASLSSRIIQQHDRPMVSIRVTTDADPAMVEIDGILVGTTPLSGLKVYTGDHVFTVGKPGYQDVTKRIVFNRNMSIKVPMISTQMSIKELQKALEKMRMHVFVGEPGIVIHNIDDTHHP